LHRLIGSTDTSKQSSPAFSFAHKMINHEPHVTASRGEIRSLVTDRNHYNLHQDGGEEVFDLQTAPLELSNLARSGPGEDDAERERMRRLIDSLSPVGHDRAFPYVPMQPRSARQN
jgi:hypothetical protein